MSRVIPNAEDDPTYLGHKTVESREGIYSFPVFSDPKKNEKAEALVSERLKTDIKEKFESREDIARRR